MVVTRGELSGVLVIEPKVFGDTRGFFMETWQRPRYREAGVSEEFVQDNLSLSRRSTIRGLHYQNPRPQGKLVSVLIGEVFDVVVDLRRSSPTFGKWQGITLSDSNRRQLYVPPGFAHGFAVLSESALFHYKCTELYSAEDERTIAWNDPDLAITWPVSNPLISRKDAQGTALRDVSKDLLFL
ncbi:MAG: dTDP-4-dehydrorhamnose 3,5-epimerase [Verrucomicrobiia bacterium]